MVKRLKSFNIEVRTSEGSHCHEDSRIEFIANSQFVQVYRHDYTSYTCYPIYDIIKIIAVEVDGGGNKDA